MLPLPRHTRILRTPVGLLSVTFDHREVVESIRFGGAAEAETGEAAGGGRGAGILRQIEDYFAGNRRQFQFLLAPNGTPFQVAVWTEIQKIPWGATLSYQELTDRLGNPHATRAVARAVGANPIAIVIPCHRVVGSDGSLTGYAGGLEIKQQLLELENAWPIRRGTALQGSLF